VVRQSRSVVDRWERRTLGTAPPYDIFVSHEPDKRRALRDVLAYAGLGTEFAGPSDHMVLMSTAGLPLGF
jgi:hypothetical protein